MSIRKGKNRTTILTVGDPCNPMETMEDLGTVLGRVPPIVIDVKNREKILLRNMDEVEALIAGLGLMDLLMNSCLDGVESGLNNAAMLSDEVDRIRFHRK